MEAHIFYKQETKIRLDVVRLSNDFYTFNEYIRKTHNPLTPSMEDYLEMLCRLSREVGFVRIHELSEALNVQPPSATRMVQKLAEQNLVRYEKYSYIILTAEGKEIGTYLIERHNTIESFLELIGVTDLLLEETEKIEHILSPETLECISKFIRFMNSNQDVKKRLDTFRKAF